MEIEYELTLADITAFVRYLLRHGPKLKPLPLVHTVTKVFLFVMVLLICLAGWFSLWPDDYWLAGFCAGIVAGLLLTVIVLAWMQSKIVIPNAVRVYEREESGWFLAWRRFKISAEGFEFTNEFQQSRISWSVVWRIESTSEHAFFFTTLQQAHIIPARAFRDEHEFEEFIDLARRYHQGRGPRETGITDILDALPARPTGITRLPSS